MSMAALEYMSQPEVYVNTHISTGRIPLKREYRLIWNTSLPVKSPEFVMSLPIFNLILLSTFTIQT